MPAVTSVAVPVDGNESDIGDDDNESHGSIETETTGEIIENETGEDTEESGSMKVEKIWLQ